MSSGSEKIFQDVLALLQQPGFEKALRINLEAITCGGFSILQSAIATNSEMITGNILILLQQPGFEKLLFLNLEHFSKNNFSVLQAAICSGSEKIFYDVLILLQQPGFEKALRLNLEKMTRDGFSVLQAATLSKSERVVSEIVILLQQPGFEKLLSLNLGQFTSKNFGVLQSAICSGSEKIFYDILTLLQQPGFEKLLFLNLEKFTNKNVGVLQNAILSGSAKIVCDVLTVLQKPGFGKALLSNFKNFSEARFDLLPTAIKTESENIFNQVFEMLCQPQHQKILIQNLLSQNQYGYNTLNEALIHLSDRDFVRVCKQLCSDLITSQQRQKALEFPCRHLAKILIPVKPELQGKIKYYFKMLHDELGKKYAIYYLSNVLDSDKSFTTQVKEKYLNLLKQSANYNFYSKKEIINVLLQEFSSKRYELHHLPLLQECTFGLTDITYQDEKGKSLLWCAAQAGAFGHPQFLLKLWNQFHERLELGDVIRREGEKADGTSVIWFILFAYRLQLNNNELAEMIKEIWKRYPSAFDLNFLPRDELKKPLEQRRSIEMLLQRIGNLGKDILSSLKPVAENPSKVILPVAGIGSKYLLGQIPILPRPLAEVPVKKPLVLSTCLLKQMVDRGQLNQVIGIELNVSEGFKVTFYSNLSLAELKNKNVTFVCAGRKEKALVPMPEEGVVIWVLTAAEYQAIRNIIPDNQSVLVVNKLSHDLMGNFEQLGLVAARRLAMFLFAHHVDLQHFIMLDDNIEKILLKGSTHQPESNWDAIYQQVRQLQNNKVCVSVQTQTSQSKKISSGQLGCKFFLIDMAKIKQKLPVLEMMFSLLPSSKDASLWGEDYYFQIMLGKLFPNQGYQILAEEAITLVRAKTQRNAYLSSVPQQDKQPIAKLFLLPDIFEDAAYPYRKQVIEELNQIIQSNIERARKQQNELAQADLLTAHAKANQARSENVKSIKVSQENVVANLEATKPGMRKHPRDRSNRADISKKIGIADNESVLAFKNFIQKINFASGNSAHYPHQIEAIKSIANQQETSGQIVMATGTGKTRVQCELARMAYRLATDGQMIMIVTPQLTLVEQFYRDFVKFSRTKTADVDLSIPADAIIKVSSQQDSVNVDALLANVRIKKQKSVVIFCEKCFQLFLPHLEQYNPYICLMDEFHEYAETAKQVINHHTPMVKLGFTATPPKDCFKTTFYRFSIADALKAKRLAPVVIDTINREFSVDDIDDFIEALPALLSRPHPCAATKNNKARLKELTGIIYLPSIEDCEKAKKYLKTKGIHCYAIHSQNKQSDIQIALFKSQKAGILLACQMLRVGFDHHALGFVIIAQAVNNMQTLEQMVGRVMRLDGEKLGNVITFKDISKKVKEITGLLTEKHALNASYDSLDDMESYDKTIVVKKKTLKLTRLNELTPQQQFALPIAQATTFPRKRRRID